MPFNPDLPFPKSAGDPIKSKDWNDLVNETRRLDTAKAERNGAEAFSGPLTVAGSLGVGSATAPTGALEVTATAWNRHLRLVNTSNAGAGPGLFFKSSARDWAILATHGGSTAGAGKLNVWDATAGRSRLTIDDAGNLGVGVDAPAEKLQVDGRMRAGNLGVGPWPANANYQFVGVATLDQGVAGNYALLQSAVGGDQGTTFVNSPETVRLRIGNVDRAVLEKDGRFTFNFSSNGLRISDGWTSFPDSANNRAEISNDIGTYKTLMIVGNKSAGLGRRVSVWDRLEVNGAHVVANGGMSVQIGVASGPYANDGIRGNPNLWLDAVAKVIIKQGFESRGMDVAERFPVAEPVEAGQVMVYDEGARVVKPCTRAADPVAVGIVSEAPAMLIGRGEGEAPIALCGRVPCWVDADIAPIRAGDLLVTSPTPGHAQRLPEGASGAGRVIGKALESLERGRGRILALVLAA
ncbi:hypothetical protein [Azohydromonas aeria]|uniref:hypothetical protein n=1 Tax=Azohydromonas aeria TaxID=2590212 RepID=UPI0012F750DF|nr:hypothetical protein [Azohydromonas aeria]